MPDTDLIQLYSKRILALAADIPLTRPLDGAPDGAAKKRSPLCGSTVSVALRVEDGQISEFAQDVKACALGQASAAVLGGVVIGRTRDEIASGRNALHAMLKAGAEPPGAPFDGLEVLAPAKDYKNRHASILLAWDATLAALDEAAAQRVG
ncbi:iron-sulfur cluster assembly scaffold protein [Pikeienuella piscinae]|uniref:Iron-sulfur cluster assembly scaffold protein n=1 Tax=Pikeienuella piscinae TaxID=2748098 RepID=A0A7L5BUM0_9RHOB|nr:iron-sulfur cluster assembly scaffold protein [Pikeienuella piscinae]QIE54418.1 iron-sulfur cluster assembly scaffold protein [Pikeienuella piscinae]